MTITWRNLAVKERREKEQQLAGEEYGINRGIILRWKK